MVVGGSEEQDEALVEGHGRNRTGVLCVFELLVLGNRVPKDQLSIVAPSGQQLQFGHHHHS